MRESSARVTKSAPVAAPAVRGLLAVVVLVLPILFMGGAMSRAQTPVGLGTAGSYAVLAGETITNTGPTTINGDVGLHPGSSVTGFDSVTQTGTLNVANAAAQQAKVDLVTAYNDAAGQGPATIIATELGGQVLTAGVYASDSGTFEITGTLTLDAEGDPDATFIFQMASTLVTASASSVNVINGVGNDHCNVYWQVGSSATLGTGTSFLGTILALTSIALNTGATIQGRALARNGEVTMDTNTIVSAACQPPTPPTTTTAPPTTTTAPPPTTPPPTTPPTSVPPPVGGVDTGGGSTSGVENVIWLIAGGALLTGAAGALAFRRRATRSGSSS